MAIMIATNMLRAARSLPVAGVVAVVFVFLLSAAGIAMAVSDNSNTSNTFKASGASGTNNRADLSQHNSNRPADDYSQPSQTLPPQQGANNMPSMPTTPPQNYGQTDNESQTSVTVNSESVTVQDGESYNDSYTTRTEDGSTHVQISVNNHSSSTGSGDSQTQLRSRERTKLQIKTESSSTTSQDSR